MSLIVAILLGLVQGLAEFLPISSSGHLVAVPFAVGVEQPTLAFAVALHVGTLVGVVAALRNEVRILIRTVFGWGAASDVERLLVKLLIIGTIPAAVIGLAASAVLGDNFDRPVLVGFLLIGTGMMLNSTEHRIAQAEHEPSRGEVTEKDAWKMGFAQAVAILPGISRSGATISIGVRAGLSRQAASRFSFLLSVPAIAGAAVLELPDAVSQGLFSEDLVPTIAGVGVAAVAGWWAIRWFLGIVGRIGLRPFGRYCWLAGIFTLLLATAKA